MILEEKDLSPLANKADALLFFVDDTGNASSSARKNFPDICQVTQMMFMAKAFPSGGIVFKTSEGKYIIVGQDGPAAGIIDQLLEMLSEHDIDLVNVAPTDNFNIESVKSEVAHNGSGPTLVFCKRLD